MTLFSKKNILICSCVLAAALLAVCIPLILNGKSIRHSSQSDYSSLNQPAAVQSNPVDLDKLSGYSDIVVSGKVENVLPTITKEVPPEKGSFESAVASKTGNSDYSVTLVPVTIDIDKVIKGQCGDSKITMYILPVGQGCSPDFKSGDKYVFFLSHYNLGNYCPSTLQQGYYHIADDSRVYPALVTDYSKKYSGMSLDDFCNKIKSVSKNI